MKVLFRPPRVVFQIVFRLGLLTAIIILIPTVIYHTGRAGSSGEPLLFANAPGTAADLSLRMVVSPGLYYAGGDIEFALSVTNLGQSAASSVALTDKLPSGLILVSATSTSGSCLGTGSVVCHLLTIQPGMTESVSITASPNTNGLETNSAVVVTTDAESVLSNNHASQSFMVLPPSQNTTLTQTVEQAFADLSLTAIAAPEQVYQGERVTYQAAITNTGPDTAHSIILTDFLPAQVSLLSIIPDNICSGLTTLICNLGDQAPGATTQITLTATAKGIGLATNSIEVASQEVDPFPDNNTAQVDVTVNPSADLSASLIAVPNSASPGQVLTYTVQMTNHGPSNVDSVQFTDTLPAGVTLDSVQPSQGTCTGSSIISCSLGEMVAYATANILLWVNVPTNAHGTLVNSAVISSAEHDPVPGNNTAQLSTPVNDQADQADLALKLTSLPDSVVAGSDLTYQMTVVNNGPSTARQVSVVNTLPDGVTFVSSTPGASTCKHSGKTITCTQDSLEPEASFQATIDVTVNPTASGSITDNANVTTSTNEPIPGNNSASTTTTANPPPPQDSSPPSIAWTDPLATSQDGSIYTANPGTLTLAVNASDASGIAQVQFLRWDSTQNTYVNLGAAKSGPYSISIPTSSLNMGSNQIFAVAYDTYGNQSSLWIWVVRDQKIFLPMVMMNR